MKGHHVLSDEEQKDEDKELAHDDDEEDEDEIKHTQLPKEVVRVPSPIRRVQNAPVWKHMQCISKYNVPDRTIKADYTHICVCPLSDDEEGSKRYWMCSMDHILSTRTFQETTSTFKCGEQAERKIRNSSRKSRRVHARV